MGICRFCGEDRKLTREHAWPDWALEYVRRSDPGDHRVWWVNPDGSTTVNVGQEPALRVKIMCAECNNVRLSRLEQEAKHILVPLIDGGARTVLKTDVDLIATWAVKTAMVFEFAARVEPRPIFTTDERRAMAFERTIPDRTNVSLARFTEARPTAFSNGMYLDQPEGSCSMLVLTVSLRNLIVQVIHHNDEEREAVPFSGDRSQIKDIWPTRQNLVWPPRVGMDNQSMWKFATPTSDARPPQRPPITAPPGRRPTRPRNSLSPPRRCPTTVLARTWDPRRRSTPTRLRSTSSCRARYSQAEEASSLRSALGKSSAGRRSRPLLGDG